MSVAGRRMPWGRILMAFAAVVVLFGVVLAATAGKAEARIPQEPIGHGRHVVAPVANRHAKPVAPVAVDYFGVTEACFTDTGVFIVRYDTLRFVGNSWGPLQDDGRYGLQVRVGVSWYDVVGEVPGGEHVLRYSEAGVPHGGWFAHGADAVRLIRTDGTGRTSVAYPIDYSNCVA